MAKRETGADDRWGTALARLYAAPLDTFTKVRKTLAAELKAAGAREDAEAMAKAKKPSRSAWALNQVAQASPEVIEAFLEATARVRDAQRDALKRGDAAALREAGKAMTSSIRDLARRAGQAVGGAAAEAIERSIAGSLRTVPFATAEDIDNLRRGTLIADIDAPSDFGVFGDIPFNRESKVPAQSIKTKNTKHIKEAARTETKRDKTADRAKLIKERKDAEQRERRERKEREAREAELRRAMARADALRETAKRAESAASELEKEAAEAKRHAARVETRAARAREEANRANEQAREARAQLTELRSE